MLEIIIGIVVFLIVVGCIAKAAIDANKHHEEILKKIEDDSCCCSDGSCGTGGENKK